MAGKRVTESPLTVERYDEETHRPETKEMRVQASVGGRRMTLDPIGIGEFDITLPMREVEVPIVAGFQVPWGEVQTEEHGEIGLTTGAGVGSPYGILSMGKEGERRYFLFNANDLLNRIVNAVLSHDTAAVEAGDTEDPSELPDLDRHGQPDSRPRDEVRQGDA